MAESKRECPMCAEFMRLVERERTTIVPGFSDVVRTTVREWVCPECDYFEDADDEKTPSSAS